MAGGGFTDVVVHSSKSYHQEPATEPRRLPKYVVDVRGAVILRFHTAANLAGSPSFLCSPATESCGDKRRCVAQQQTNDTERRWNCIVHL
jgi:hypothetical protein